MDWTDIIVNVILAVIGAALPVILKVGFDVLKQQKYIKDSELLQKRIEAVQGLLATDLVHAYHEFTLDIKKKMADGDLTAEEGAAALLAVKDHIVREFAEDWPEYVEALGLGRISKELQNLYEGFRNEILGK